MVKMTKTIGRVSRGKWYISAYLFLKVQLFLIFKGFIENNGFWKYSSFTNWPRKNGPYTDIYTL